MAPPLMPTNPSYARAIRRIRILLDPALNNGADPNEALDVACEALTFHAPQIEARNLAAAHQPLDPDRIDQVRHAAGLHPLQGDPNP